MSEKKRYISNRISLLLLTVLTLLLALDIFTGLFLKNLTNIEKMAIYVIIYIIPMAVYIRLSKVKATRIMGLSFIKFKYLPFILLFGLSTSIICALINAGSAAVFASFLDITPQETTVDFVSDRVFVLVITSVLLPAVCEELLIRGIALSEYARYGVSVSVIMTSIVFALFHGNVTAIPSLFVAGVFYAVLTHLFKSVWPAIICHVINNGLSLYIALNTDFLRYLLSDVIFIVVIVCLLFIVLYITLRLLERVIDDLGSKRRLKTNVKQLAYGDPLGSIYIWVFFALSIFICVRNVL